MLFNPLIPLLLVCCIAFTSYSRDNTDLADLPPSFFAKVNKKTTSLERDLTRQPENTIFRIPVFLQNKSTASI